MLLTALNFCRLLANTRKSSSLFRDIVAVAVAVTVAAEQAAITLSTSTGSILSNSIPNKSNGNSSYRNLPSRSRPFNIISTGSHPDPSFTLHTFGSAFRITLTTSRSLLFRTARCRIVYLRSSWRHHMLPEKMPIFGDSGTP